MFFKEYVAPALAPRGFVANGRNYRLTAPSGDMVLVEFQTSSGSFPDRYAFFVNIGLITVPWVAYVHDAQPSRVGRPLNSGFATPEGRIRAKPGGRDEWVIRDTDDAHECGTAVGAAFDRDVPEYLELLDRDVLLARLSGNGPRPARFYGPGTHRAALLAARGPSAELDPGLGELGDDEADKQFAEWARRYAHASAEQR